VLKNGTHITSYTLFLHEKIVNFILKRYWQWPRKGGANGARSWAKTLGAHQQTLFSHLNVFLSRILDKNMPKMYIFWKKAKKSLQRRGIRITRQMGVDPRPPCCYSHLMIYLSSAFLTLTYYITSLNV